MTQSKSRSYFIVHVFVALTAANAFAQGTGFNFQGRPYHGTNPANGRYDLQFRLFDAFVGGNPIGSLVSRPNTTLVNGVFSVTLDFGSTAFNSPNSVFIEIAVHTNGSPNAFTILVPRQQLTVVPFAVRAANAVNADTAVYRPGAQGIFYVQESTAGFAAMPWGITGDRPTANAYVY